MSFPALMGILNLTPDSFSDGGALPTVEAAVRRAWQLVEDGAAIVDVGGESTRPGAAPVDVATEISRVLPVLEALRDLPAQLCIDTYKPEVARAAVERGAVWVNDITGLRSPAMLDFVAQSGVGVVIMHMRGTPQEMQRGEIDYSDVVAEVREFLAGALERFEAAGGERARVMVDPGIGFGKTTLHNLELTRRLGELGDLGCPVLYGASRKNFLGEIVGKPPGERDLATAAACVAAVLAGASVLRVHNVALVGEAVRVAAACRRLDFEPEP